jgi:hypothetical protein
MNQDEDLFIGINENLDLRKNLLEGSKSVVHSLQRFRNLQVIRQEKLLALEHLESLAHEIKYLINQLKKELPDAKAKANKKAKITKAKSKKQSPMGELAGDLSEIESKLKQLTS